MGSEMCIRDRFDDVEHPVYAPLDGRTVFVDESLRSENANIGRHNFTLMHEACHLVYGMLYPCLLYTSDAADEEDSVDLGGRRIIKKKKKEKNQEKKT